MQPEPRHQTTASPIRVSEIGDWVYCNLAWKLRSEGVPATAAAEVQLQEGRRWHAEPGETVARADTAHRVRALCTVLALLAATTAAILWILK